VSEFKSHGSKPGSGSAISVYLPVRKQIFQGLRISPFRFFAFQLGLSVRFAIEWIEEVSGWMAMLPAPNRNAITTSCAKSALRRSATMDIFRTFHGENGFIEIEILPATKR